MRRTYIKVDGKVSTYDYDEATVKLWKRIKRPHCEICTNGLRSIYTKGDEGNLRLGYYCPVCKKLYMDRSKGDVVIATIELGGIK
jgi:hypothetical protein